MPYLYPPLSPFNIQLLTRQSDDSRLPKQLQKPKSSPRTTMQNELRVLGQVQETRGLKQIRHIHVYSFRCYTGKPPLFASTKDGLHSLWSCNHVQIVEAAFFPPSKHTHTHTHTVRLRFPPFPSPWCISLISCALKSISVRLRGLVREGRKSLSSLFVHSLCFLFFFHTHALSPSSSSSSSLPLSYAHIPRSLSL